MGGVSMLLPNKFQSSTVELLFNHNFNLISISISMQMSKSNKSKRSISKVLFKNAAKSAKNQFAINRLVLMLMDIDPENLSSETICDLESIYELLCNIHEHQRKMPNKSNKKLI